MVFHTGLQAGNYGRISDANPLLLQSLAEFPARALIFSRRHALGAGNRRAGKVFSRRPPQHGMDASHFPPQARSALSEWLDMLPNNKIFGFGGDYDIVEKSMAI